jgi:hypothetical protein
MAYIGNQPTDNFVTFATQNFSTSATSSYTLSHAVSNENEIALFINNVRQHPGSGKAYTASGTALTLSANTASTDVMYCIFLGRAIQSTVPATNSVTSAMLNLTTLSTTGITDNGSANSITIDTNGHVTMPLQSAVHAYPSTAQDDMATGIVTIVLGAEIYDVNSDFNTSNSTFTAPVTGKYQVNASVSVHDVDTAFQWMYGVLLVSSNRNYYMQQIDPRIEISSDGLRQFNASTLVDMDANDTLLLKIRTSSHGATQQDLTIGDASAAETFLTVHLAC